MELPAELSVSELESLEGKQTPVWQLVLRFSLPFWGMLVLSAEYLLIPDRFPNPHPERYLLLGAAFLLLYLLTMLFSRALPVPRRKALRAHLVDRAPLYLAIYLFLALFDYLTLKTGILTQPFIPWVNAILNAAIGDAPLLLKSTLFSLKLLFSGYFFGVVSGLITGIACGYSRRVRYWINPLIRVLGPIPTVTWVPLVMILARSLFAGSVFIVALGTWFSVTVATMTGVSTVDFSYFAAARTLGAKPLQLILHVAIPHAMPSILQGMTQGMNSACISLMIAEMLGVEAGLGWYITWVKAWAAFDKMFAAIFVICLTFNVVTRLLDGIKRYLLRWQNGVA